MFGSIKITDYIKIKLRSSLTLYLAFESIRHHSISGAFKNMFQERLKMLSKNFFFCISNFLALTILQSETVKLNFAKSYILTDVVRVLTLV